uniref:Uncharacterized protein n=1 Tax=Klebsiella pneumoniae TaxID=573 RepID=A0A8B0SX04_KLEPN|nr:hypothetical protein [Klebsiella pneumoniae]
MVFELADFKELFYVFLPGSACLPLHHCRAKNTRSLEPETKQATSVISAVWKKQVSPPVILASIVSLMSQTLDLLNTGILKEVNFEIVKKSRLMEGLWVSSDRLECVQQLEIRGTQWLIFLYWDYLVWFSYAAMPVVIFIILF